MAFVYPLIHTFIGDFLTFIGDFSPHISEEKPLDLNVV